MYRTGWTTLCSPGNNFIANALELLESCTEPSVSCIYHIQKSPHKNFKDYIFIRIFNCKIAIINWSTLNLLVCRMLRHLLPTLPALSSRLLPTLPSSARMLHSILHQHRHWRQAGQLQCSFCSSARYAAQSDDPLAKVKDNPYFDRYADKIREKQQ